MDYLKLWLAGITITVFLLFAFVIHISNTQVKIINEIRTGGNYPPEQMFIMKACYTLVTIIIQFFMLPTKIILKIIKEIKNAIHGT
jgi:hypothetical protein